MNVLYLDQDWGEPTGTLVPWRQGFRYPTRNECMGCFTQICGSVPGNFLGIVGQDPSDSKSNRLHVDIFQFFFHSFEVYSSIDYFKMIGNSP